MNASLTGSFSCWLHKRRADRVASKFLKKELRLPKKLAAGSAGSMSASTFSNGGLTGRPGFGRFRRKG